MFDFVFNSIVGFVKGDLKYQKNVNRYALTTKENKSKIYKIILNYVVF